MLKLRLMGTTNEIKWFQKILDRHSKITILENSEMYPIKGSKRFNRVYMEVEKNVKKK